MYEQLIIAIDPGRDKCGLAAVDLQGNMLELELVPRPELAKHLGEMLTRWRTDGRHIAVIMGNGTYHQQVLKELEQYLTGIEIGLVEEYGTTLAARELYWQHNKVTGWQRLLPPSWRSTPPLDAYAALAIAKLHIKNML